MKDKVLSDFSRVDLDGPHIKRRHRVAVWMEEVISASRAVPITTIAYRGFDFEDPAKWVVAFLGTTRGLFNLEALDIGSDPKTNLLIICLTNESIEPENVEYVKDLIGKTQEGGFLLVGYNETDALDELGFEEKVDHAIGMVKSAIDLYPSKNVPII